MATNAVPTDTKKFRPPLATVSMANYKLPREQLLAIIRRPDHAVPSK